MNRSRSAAAGAKRRRKCFLVCNAHLDPVWVWPWEDGMVEAISTYRVAADFCDRYPDFVFNHNESLLYEWVERNDPALFARIRALVRRGRWHVAGGSYVQPDLIAALGESLIRQHLVAKTYFREAFGVEPTTAYCFDSFGHPQGLIQILAGCGFDSYIFCRPPRAKLPLPVGPFRWRHASGVEIVARRSDEHYITQGGIRDKMRGSNWPEYYRSEGDFLFLWGIGNHGGGPSHAEYAQFAKMREDFPDIEFIESTPEAFFRHALRQRPRGRLPVVTGDLKPFAEGCYTSMQRVKTGHRRMENLMSLTERLAALAWWRGRRAYPAADLSVAWKDILFCEFHDILPGSAIPSVEQDSLSLLGHCEEILRRKRAEAIIALLRDEPLAERNSAPIFVFNPHSWEVTQEVEMEYCLDRQFAPDSVVRRVTRGGAEVSAQFEKAEHNLDDAGWSEWRQKAVFLATVPPLSFRRFDTDYTVLPPEQVRRWTSPPLPRASALRVRAGSVDVCIDTRTGLLGPVRHGGATLLGSGSCQPLVFHDLENSWGTITEWSEPAAAFRLATPLETARIIGSEYLNPGYRQRRQPVSIIEDGPIRMVVEAVFVHDQSYLVQHYVISKLRPVLRVEQTIFWTEHDRLLRLQLVLGRRFGRVEAEKCYSIDDETRPAPRQGKESDFQRFLRFSAGGRGGALAVVGHGSHGYQHRGQALRLSVLRSPAYSAMKTTPECQRIRNRYIPRQDQGVCHARFTLLFAEKAATAAAAARAACEENVPLDPFVYFPTSRTDAPPARRPFVTVSAANVLLAALKKEERGEGLILRFWEIAGRATTYTFEVDGRRHRARIGARRLQTFRFDRDGALSETDLIERSIP